MGQEAQCVLRRDGKAHSGKALLETAELIFRGPSLRLKAPFSSMKSVTAEAGELRFKTRDGFVVLELGTKAEKWREKILHPKSRIEKLGVKQGARVELAGKFDADFVAELKSVKATARESDAKEPPEWIFLGIEARGELGRIATAAKKLRGAAGLWIVYPKGKKTVTETDVITAGRKAGLKDVKVAGSSGTQTALKFVIPVAKR